MGPPGSASDLEVWGGYRKSNSPPCLCKERGDKDGTTAGLLVRLGRHQVHWKDLVSHGVKLIFDPLTVEYPLPLGPAAQSQ